MAIHSATVMSSGRGEEGGSSGGSGVSTEKGEEESIEVGEQAKRSRLGDLRGGGESIDRNCWDEN